LGTCCRDFSASPEKNYTWMLDRQADLLAMDPHSTSIVLKNLGIFLARSIHWIWKNNSINAERTGGAITELQKRVCKEAMRRILIGLLLRCYASSVHGRLSSFPFQTGHKATIEGLFNLIPHYFHLSLRPTTKRRGLKKRLACSAALAGSSSDRWTIDILRSQSEDRLRLPNSSVLTKRHVIGR
jgi:hypothetical protein